MKINKHSFETPILFITFNKEDTTKTVLKKILEMNPKYLIIASDGPRNKKEEEVIKNLRSYFDNTINGNFIKIYSESNKGCKEGVRHAISKSFELFDELIIVEDDILPSKKFFKFSEKMLHMYRDEKQINLISGYNYLIKSKTNLEFYFSKYSLIWGWATWKDRWEENISLNEETLNYFIESKADKVFGENDEKLYFLKHFRDVVNHNLDSWAFGVTFSNFFNNKLTIVPKYNLTRNLGLGHKSATHTKSKLSFKIVTLNVSLSIFQKLDISFQKPFVSEVNDEKYRNKIILKNTLYNRLSYFLFKKIYK